jgi:hypothetical protein
MTPVLAAMNQTVTEEREDGVDEERFVIDCGAETPMIADSPIRALAEIRPWRVAGISVPQPNDP